jgi:hypothetical protein
MSSCRESIPIEECARRNHPSCPRTILFCRLAFGLEWTPETVFSGNVLHSITDPASVMVFGKGSFSVCRRIKIVIFGLSTSNNPYCLEVGCPITIPSSFDVPGSPVSVRASHLSKLKNCGFLGVNFGSG